MSNDEVHIGKNGRRRIAFWVDEIEAISLAYLYGPHDGVFKDLMDAIEEAYPDEDK